MQWLNSKTKEMTMPLLERIAQSADRLSDEMIALRRTLHEHPELAFEEQDTAKRVEEVLGRLGIECRTGIGKTGIGAVLQGAKPGPTFPNRCRNGGVPINGPVGFPECLKVPGKMHACGHDAH